MDKDEQADDDGLAVGEIIADKYRVEREIGRGGMGVVVAARHLDLDQPVAIKILQKSSAFNQDALARFLREARSAAKIRSEHVARVMDVGKLDDGLTYIVMEYLEGSDLADLLRAEGQFRVTTAADYILQACEGIAAAHAAGIIHRDIKPANLFVARQPGRPNTIKILDFGVSKIAKKENGSNDSAATQAGQIFGSPMYMSPEQLDSTVAVDCRTDIWALGVVLYELLAGKPPFSGKSSANIMTSVMRDPIPKLREMRPDIPSALEEVVTRCLEKEREQRYATVIDLAEAIAPFCGKGADDAVNRIYQILAHAASEEAATHSESSPQDGERTSTGSSSGSRSDQRRSNPKSDSAMRSLGGSSRTQGDVTASSKRWAAVMGVIGVVILAVAGVAVLREKPQPAHPAGMPSAPVETAQPTTPSAAQATVSPSATTADSADTKSNDVTITFMGAPNETKIFQGDAEIGTTATPLKLPRSMDKLTLRFVAESFAPTDVELIPNVDQTVTIALKSPKPAAPVPAPAKRKVPKELEPF